MFVPNEETSCSLYQLMHRGAFPFNIPQDGTTALMAASVRGHKDVVDALLRHGANVDQQNLDGHTALMFAYNGRNQVTNHEVELVTP